MIRSHWVTGLGLAPIALAIALAGPSCQSVVEDMDGTGGEELGGSGGGDTTGGTSTGGMGGMGGAQGGMAGEGSGGLGTGGTTSSCDPAVQACAGATIVHVSPDGDDTADGSAEAPIASLGEALVRVAALVEGGEEFPLIYLCATAGPYGETLGLGAEHGAVGIFGGFDCDGFVSSEARAVLVAAGSSGHRIEGATKVTLGDLQLEAPDANGAGRSSVALTVVDSTEVRLLRSDLLAGEGSPGASGMGYSDPAESGATGNAGTAACVAGASEVNPGGPAAVTSCGGETTASVGGLGGPGGGGLLPTAGVAGDPGEPDGGPAGKGEDATACENGDNGEPGAGGEHGTPSVAFGTVDEDGYTPPQGGDGSPGALGRGGGGGGGAAKPGACETGASGGSGGGGGCPGAPAAGGRGGGGSFGLISVASSIELVELNIIVAVGGEGGAGGDGQVGGDGADPGGPGLGASGGNDACSGGNGGRGGNGGSGAGGAGGPSVGVVHVAPVSVSETGVTVDLPPSAADGGPGGVQYELAGAGPTGLLASSWAP